MIFLKEMLSGGDGGGGGGGSGGRTQQRYLKKNVRRRKEESIKAMSSKENEVCVLGVTDQDQKATHYTKTHHHTPTQLNST